MKKTIVYIDGENLLHRIDEVLQSSGEVGSKSQIIHFNFKELLKKTFDKSKKTEIRYYGTKIRAKGLAPRQKNKALEIIESQRRLKKSLEKQGIKFVVCGSLQPRIGKECLKCKNRTSYFQEKGVDVKIAVDLVVDSQKKDIEKIVLVSSDSDLLPAIEQVNNNKVNIEYVFVKDNYNWAIGRQTGRKYCLSQDLIVKIYKDAK